MRFLGSASRFPHVQGMFQEYFVMGERQCYPVAGDISLGELAFAEPLAVGLHGVNRGGDLLGKSVLITGAGTIGCVTVIAARLAGARKITVTDVLDRPLSQADWSAPTSRCVRTAMATRCATRSSTSPTRSRAISTRSRPASPRPSAAA